MVVVHNGWEISGFYGTGLVLLKLKLCHGTVPSTSYKCLSHDSKHSGLREQCGECSASNVQQHAPRKLQSPYHQKCCYILYEEDDFTIFGIWLLIRTSMLHPQQTEDNNGNLWRFGWNHIIFFKIHGFMNFSRKDFSLTIHSAIVARIRCWIRTVSLGACRRHSGRLINLWREKISEKHYHWECAVLM